MPTLTTEAIRVDGVTFVEVLLEAEHPHRIRLETRFDGPVWPPRTNGTAVDCWDDDGVATAVGAGTTAFGFATPVSLEEQAVEIVRAEPIARGLPDGISGWIERVETRVETAEMLSDVDDLAAATDAIASVGGLSAVEILTAEIARDRRLVTRLSILPDELCERFEAVEIPAATFARIAQEDSF